MTSDRNVLRGGDGGGPSAGTKFRLYDPHKRGVRGPDREHDRQQAAGWRCEGDLHRNLHNQKHQREQPRGTQALVDEATQRMARGARRDVNQWSLPFRGVVDLESPNARVHLRRTNVAGAVMLI